LLTASISISARFAPPPFVDVSMIAPKSPGHRMGGTLRGRCRRTGASGHPSGCNGPGEAKRSAYAWATASQAGVIETSFKEETESDLFGEQSVCAAVSALSVKAAFETLVEAGVSAEIA